MNIREIITSAGMSARPAYYSGRGPHRGDLNLEKLNTIADGIQKHYGIAAHDNFAEMVWAMQSLSATAFLDRVYALEAHGWDLAKIKDRPEKHTAIDSDEVAYSTVIEAVKNLGHKSTPKIKRCKITEDIRFGFRRGLSLF